MKRIGGTRTIATILGISLALAACSTGKPKPSELDPSASSVGMMLAGSPAEGAVMEQEYRLKAGDQVRMKFLFHKELDTNATVRDDGQVSVPGLGDLAAAGLTAEEVEANIYRRASLTYRDPEVSLIVERPTDLRAYVGGEVRRPGFVPIRQGMTSLRAIFEAGGFLDTAKVDHVLHVRWGSLGTYDARVVDLKHVLESGDMRGDILLSPNDVVFVPKTAIANADLWVRQYVLDLVPIREPSTRMDDFR